MARRRHRHYSPEFKAEALRVVQQSDEPMATIARNLGVNKTTLLHWVEAARPEPRDRGARLARVTQIHRSRNGWNDWNGWSSRWCLSKAC